MINYEFNLGEVGMWKEVDGKIKQRTNEQELNDYKKNIICLLIKDEN